MADEVKTMTLPDPPRGMVEARVDDKGRLRVPAVVEKYLKSFGDTEFFITSLDGETGRVYPLSIWKLNETSLQTPGPHAKAAKQILLLANIFGHVGKIEAQERMLLPTNMRRELGLEGEQVWLLCSKGQVTVYNSQKLAVAKQAATNGAPEALEQIEGSVVFY